MWKKLPITSITPFTFQDYPERTAAILWFSGCNMSCSYCHNPELVRGQCFRLSAEQIVSFLHSRQGLLEAIVLSGGECTLCDALPWLTSTLIDMGYHVKIDTNGTRPEMLRRLVKEKQINYIALDVKAPPQAYRTITGFDNIEAILSSLRLLASEQIDCEVRTTVRTDIVDEVMVNEIIDILHEQNWRKPYYVQNYQHGETLASLPAPKRPFNPSLVKKASFDIRFRNF
jgi:pyruvate formate lyase activating enzyme